VLVTLASGWTVAIDESGVVLLLCSFVGLGPN